MGNYKLLEDAELFGLLRTGDQCAFAEIYRRYWDLLFARAVKLLRDADEAQDLVQEVFVAIWMKAAEIPFSDNLSGYLYTALRHKILNRLRHQKVQEDYLAHLALFMKENVDTTFEKLNGKDLQAAIGEEISLLPEKMKEVFLLSREQELSHRDIARQMNISHHTVKKQVSNAVRILRWKLTSFLLLLILISW